MKALVMMIVGVGLALGLGYGIAEADTVEAIVRASLAPALPAGLGIAHVYPPASMTGLDVPAELVLVERPRELHVGRASVKVVLRSRTSKKSREAYVQVSYAALSEVAVARRALAAGDTIGEDDVEVQRRASDAIAPAAVGVVVGSTLTTDIAAGTAIGAHDVMQAPRLRPGSEVAVDVRRGGVHVHGTGTLELAARPGEQATVRLSGSKTTVRGLLVAPATVEVGAGS